MKHCPHSKTLFAEFLTSGLWPGPFICSFKVGLPSVLCSFYPRSRRFHRSLGGQSGAVSQWVTECTLFPRLKRHRYTRFIFSSATSSQLFSSDSKVTVYRWLCIECWVEPTSVFSFSCRYFTRSFIFAIWLASLLNLCTQSMRFGGLR